MIYFKANNTEYPACTAGKAPDRDWDGRASKAATLEMEYTAASQRLLEGLS